jgi:type II secretory pathway pseudopilin PulG
MFGIGTTVKALVALIIVVVVVGGMWYVTGLRANLAVSEENQRKLESAVASQQAVMDQMRRDVAQQQEINRDLADAMERQKKDVAELTDKFNVNARGEKRDFGTIAAAKPGVVERLVNRGSVNAMRCFELASGAPLNEKEKDAKTSKDLNPECPNLVQPNLPSIVK